jgi:hypothetical protein
VAGLTEVQLVSKGSELHTEQYQGRQQLQ